jgi:hypothetical protein
MVGFQLREFVDSNGPGDDKLVAEAAFYNPLYPVGMIFMIGPCDSLSSSTAEMYLKREFIVSG